jgi:hypothetical protein
VEKPAVAPECEDAARAEGPANCRAAASCGRKPRWVSQQCLAVICDEWLEAARRLRDPGLVLPNTDPLLEPLRKEPRLQAIERELRFPS